MLQYRSAKLLLIILSIAAVAYSEESNPIRTTVTKAQKPFNAIFTSIWFGGYCFNSTSPNGTCNQAQLRKWDKRSFPIHGLWPQAYAEKQYQAFNIKYINRKRLLKKALIKHWLTPWNSDTQFKYWVWDHEYNKHGVSYSNILQYYDPQKYLHASSAVLQQTYFTDTIDFYQSFNLKRFKLDLYPKQGGNPILTKKEISEIVGIDQQYFILNCKDSNILRQLKICFTIEKDLSFRPKSCKEIEEAHQTKHPIKDSCKDNKAIFYGYS